MGRLWWASIVAVVALTFLTAGAVLFPDRAEAQGVPECPGSWPQQEAEPGRIAYQDYFTDADGARWFIIRSSDSNGYTSVRAYPATDDGEGYIANSPDDVCYLIVRRPGDTEDAAEPTQVIFPKESEEPTPRTLTERDFLVALYNAAGGANWTNSDGWLTNRPLGQWYGVTTDASDRVTELSLDENNLQGTIPSALGSLANLKVLDLHENSLTGPIPSELGNLANLEVLNLWKNELTGPIPPELGNLANLKELSVGYNQLAGTLPPELLRLTALEYLGFHSNPGALRARR